MIARLTAVLRPVRQLQLEDFPAYQYSGMVLLQVTHDPSALRARLYLPLSHTQGCG